MKAKDIQLNMVVIKTTSFPGVESSKPPRRGVVVGSVEETAGGRYVRVLFRDKRAPEMVSINMLQAITEDQ